MNSFQLHHDDAISFSYSCFDRIILNGFIPAFQHTACGASIHWFLCRRRQAPQLNRAYFAKIASDYHHWVEEYAATAGLDIIEPAMTDRRENLVEPFFQQLGTRHGVAVILKARE